MKNSSFNSLIKYSKDVSAREKINDRSFSRIYDKGISQSLQKSKSKLRFNSKNERKKKRYENTRSREIMQDLYKANQKKSNKSIRNLKDTPTRKHKQKVSVAPGKYPW